MLYSKTRPPDQLIITLVNNTQGITGTLKLAKQCIKSLTFYINLIIDEHYFKETHQKEYSKLEHKLNKIRKHLKTYSETLIYIYFLNPLPTHIDIWQV